MLNENISFEDRVFKLSSGEKVDPAILEQEIRNICHYVKYVGVTGNGEDQPVALIFPNKSLLDHPDYKLTPEEGCFCPRSLNELGKCLTGCLKLVNNQSANKLKSAAIINKEEETFASTEQMMEKYKALLQKMYSDNVPASEDIYLVKLERNK